MIQLSVFICGAVVMSFEILGSRVLAPDFGSSVFVWGSLISVFLAGLSSGYWLGGRWADQRVSWRGMGGIICAAAAFLVLFPVYDRPVSDLVFRYIDGPRLGPLTASMLLFFLPSLFLGAVSPYAARLMIASVRTSGSTVGNLYALSTLGSIVGTLCTAFWLIAVAGVSKLILGQGLLLFLCALPLLLSRRS